MSADELEGLARRFRAFASRKCAGVSPLYAALGAALAGDRAPPNMLFAAVHALLLDTARDDPLAAHYASLTPHPKPPEDAFSAFKAFCRKHEDAIAALLARRAVSTNEVGRSACLMPAYARVAALAGEPLRIVEVGASAGLNLLWDRYAY
jgi:hypothetical protein